MYMYITSLHCPLWKIFFIAVHFFIYSVILKFNLFLAVLGLRCCAVFFLSLCWVETTFSLWNSGLSLQRLLLLQSQAPGCAGSVGSCSMRAAPGLSSTGLVVVAHRFRCSAAWGIVHGQGLNPRLPYGRQILYHWTTTEAPHCPLQTNAILSVNYSSIKWEKTLRI